MSQVSSISSALATDQYLQLLVTQLQNQDPLDPVSDKEFISQLAQLSSLTSLQSLDANFGEVLRLQQLTSGTNLVGKTVTYNDEDGKEQSGVVSSVAVTDGKFQLTVGTDTVALESVTSAK